MARRTLGGSLWDDLEDAAWLHKPRSQVLEVLFVGHAFYY